MNRKNLLKTLDAVSKGLERNTVIPIYEYFCFTGKTVFGFNDAFGVVAPWHVKQPFAVHGPTFKNLLYASKSDEIDVTVTHEGLSIQAGVSEYMIPIKGPDEFVWHEPEFEFFELGLDVIKGIKLCLATCSENLALEAFNRVCIKSRPPEHKVYVYATDGDALTKYDTGIITEDNVGDIDFCLSRDFCDAIISISNGNAVMKVGKEWICLETDSIKVYGHNLGPTTLDYDKKIVESLGQQVTNLVPIPEGLLDEALTRARVVSDIETAPTTLVIEKNQMLIQTTTPFGDVFDQVAVKHPDIEININAAMIQNSMKGCNQFKLTENSSVFTGDRMLRLVANLS